MKNDNAVKKSHESLSVFQQIPKLSYLLAVEGPVAAALCFKGSVIMSSCLPEYILTCICLNWNSHENSASEVTPA